jgi:transcription initiation factor TFIIE subunit beta
MTTPVPSPSLQPTMALNGFKRKRENSTSIPSVLQTTSSSGAPSKRPRGIDPTIVIHMSQAERYLKEKDTPKTFEEIVNYLSIQFAEKDSLAHLRYILQNNHPKITYVPPGESNVQGVYKYKPTIPVRNSEELQGYLQKQKNFTGVRFEDLKDGWPSCADTIDQMETQHEVLVVRDKRKVIRTVWQDDATLRTNVSDGTKHGWDEVRLPTNPDDLRAALEAAGLKSTSGTREKAKNNMHREQKRKAARRTGRTTNSHISHLLKDYSNLKGRK